MLGSLTNLTLDELRQVRDNASALLALGPKHDTKPATTEHDEFAFDLYAAVSDILYKRTHVRRMQFRVFTRTAQYRNHFLPASKIAKEANTQWFPKQSKTEQMSMAQLYAKLAIDYLDSNGRLINWYSLSGVFSTLPELVDVCFPGYAACGMLGKIQEMRTRPKRIGSQVVA